MKGKVSSTHHRLQNTYRTFSDRLAVINVDVARKVHRLAATPEDADTFFGEALRKWSELNYTQHFMDFKHDIAGTVYSFTQLIHHQKKIVAALLKHLQVADSLAYEPLLDLVVQVSRDLQSDFYPHFEEVLPVLVQLLQVHDHDPPLLEQAFTCLSYLFKFLWRAMTSHITHVYRLVAPLLGNQYREYINNFAAESFAFLMRKVKDFSALCDVMFGDLREHPDQVAGVGRLLFESVKGVQKRLHTASHKVLPVVLEKLSGDDLPGSEVCACVRVMLDRAAAFMDREHADPVWTPLLSRLRAVHALCIPGADPLRPEGGGPAEHLGRLLQVLGDLVRYKQGLLVVPADQVAQVLTELLTGPTLPGPVAEVLLEAVADLVMAGRVSLSFKHQAVLLQAVYASGYSISHLVDFTRAVFDMPMFEKDVLPRLLAFCAGAAGPTRLLLAGLVLHKAPPPALGAQVPDAASYLLDFGSVPARCGGGGAVPKEVMRHVAAFCGDLTAANLAAVWCSVLCVPHVRPLEAKDCTSVLKQLYDCAIDFAKDAEGDTKDAALCLVADVLWALSRKASPEDFFQLLPPCDVAQLLLLFGENVQALRAAALYYSWASVCGNPVGHEALTQALPGLLNNFSSPQPRIRLLTLEICSQADLPMPDLPLDADAEASRVGLFAICLEAEKVAVSVHTYRTKLMHLAKLEHTAVQTQLPLGDYLTVALRVLLGQLYVNFTFVWEPVLELIQSYAVCLQPAVFWAVYESHLTRVAGLTEAAGFCRESRRGQDADPRVTPTLTSGPDAEFRLHRARVAAAGRPDHFNFRSLLWRAMRLFPAVCEPRSKVVVPLFFRFLENEFYPANETLAPTHDIRKKVAETEEEEEDEEEDEEDEKEEEQEKGKAKKSRFKRKQKTTQRPYNSILVTHLKLFAKFKGPKSLHGEGRLKALYYELLPHRSPAVQKAAFECLMTYRSKALLPYRENIERLMDDKTFKNEVVLFNIDGESSVLQAEHRAEVLPVVITIMYGKMLTKTGRDTGGRANASVRRGLVFRFLAGCEQQELRIFFDLIFKPFSHYIKDDIYTMVLETIENTDASKVVPLKKQQSLLTTVDTILQKLGSLIDTYLPNILRVLVGILAQVGHLLYSRALLAPRAVTLLRAVRGGVVSRLTQFYTTYLTYPFSRDETQMIFKVAVWPQLELLPKEGVHSPAGLLSLFVTWSHHMRYLDLLRTRWSDTDFCVLPTVVNLLNARAASVRVVDVIMDLVYNLLSLHEEETDQDGVDRQVQQAERLDVGDVVEFDPTTKDLPPGVRVLMPYVPAVLDYIRKVVDEMLKQKGRSKALPHHILNVLARLSEYVTDAQQCVQMLDLLLPFLSRHLNRSIDMEFTILQAVTHMIRLVPQPAAYVRTIAKVFSNLSARASRSALCEALQAIAQCDPGLRPLADVVSKMNAWDRKYIEEPDYLLRLEAFREAEILVTSLDGDAYVTHTLVVIHNATFFINTMGDMSLRDSASLCVQQLMTNLAQRPKNNAAINIVVKGALLPEVKAGIKLKSEVARHEYVSLLSRLITLFPALPVFADLASLADDDIEADFFTNMVHIQLHRRGRAMRRITRTLGQHHFRTETLVGFLLPLVTSYLRDETYQKEAVVMDAVVETVGSMARCLPWPQYLALLRWYLNQLPLSLDNQKLMVRVVVAVLDSFHYDLRNSTEVSETALKAPGLSKGLETNEDSAEGSSYVTKSQDAAAQVVGEAEEAEEAGEAEGGVKASAADSTPGALTVCSPGLASRIHRTLIQIIIPHLHHSLTRKVKSDDEHRRASKGCFAEDEEVLRVPIALALVKLMQNLPHKTLDFNLPGLLFKLCVFLRSRALDIRNTARDTLVKIVKSLGPTYFSYVLKELRFALKRGYQLHVLCFTTHVLLRTLEDVLTCGDLETSVRPLVEVFNNEIFGAIAEEKNVIGITSKLMEAKSTKSYESYTILARFVSRGSLISVLSPLRSILEATSSHKTAAKVEDILHRLVPGLLSNTSLQLSDLMTFTFGLTTEVMPLLAPKKKQQDAGRDDRMPRADAFTVQPPARRAGVKAATRATTNMHILVQFGLQVLHSLLKHSTLNHKVLEHAALLDPFVPALCSCLAAKYAKVTAVSLRCLVWVFRFPLPSLRTYVKPVASALFVLIRNYAAPGAAATSDNQELLDTCFKAVTVLVRDVDYYKIKTDQLKVLLNYAEQDIHDHTRRATAFSLLKAILSRKLVVPEMHDVMRKMEELSITAHDPSVRQSCRQVVVKFLLNYPLGSRVEQHLEFYVSQLQYEHDTGRQSALEMLATMFEAFPPKLLHKYSGLFFVPLASQMVNDDSAKCRRQTALAMKQLLTQLETDTRDELFSMVIEWFKDDKVALRKLAALTCGVMVEVEVTKFERHLDTVLPLLHEQLQPEQHSSGGHEAERMCDHLLFGVLTLVNKLVRLCSLTRRPKWARPMAAIWGDVQRLLLYPHLWVRLACCELFGLLLAAWSPAELLAQTQKAAVTASPVYLQDNTMHKLHELCGAFCKQLSSPQLDEALGNQVLKNLVFLGKVLRHFPKSDEAVTDLDSTKAKKDKRMAKKGVVEEGEKYASFDWLLSRLCHEARQENANTPKETLKRTSVFKWLAAMALDLGAQHLPQFLPRMLPVLVRELTDKSPNSDEALRKLGQEVLELMKTTAGVDAFTVQYALVLKTLVDKRQMRKRERAAELVADPEVAAKRKLKKNLAKHEAKKRKLQDYRPLKRIKKARPAGSMDS